MISMMLGKRQTSTLRNPKQWLIDAWNGAETLAGTRVSTENQLEINVNLACILLIAETMGSLRPNLYKARKSGGKDVATDNPLQTAINLKPNPEMTGFTYRETSSSHVALYGNSYTYKPRNVLLQIENLWPLHPDRVTKRRANQLDLENFDGIVAENDIVYDVTTAGTTQTIPGRDIMHVPGFSANGLLGTPLVELQRLKFGIAKALDEFEALWYGKGPHPVILGETDAFLDSPKKAEYKKKLEEQYSGIAKSHSFMIVDHGIKLKEFQTRLDWSMLDERQKDIATRICGLWRVPPSLIGILDRATFNNISHLDLQFGKYCVRVWTEREENQMMCDLLTDSQLKDGYTIEYSLDDIYRTDIETLNRALKEAWDRGVISADEWRTALNRNPKPGNNGKLYYVPINYAVEGTEAGQNGEDRQARIVPIRQDDAI